MFDKLDDILIRLEEVLNELNDTQANGKTTPGLVTGVNTIVESLQTSNEGLNKALENLSATSQGTINALTAVNSVLIPIQCEFYALEGVVQLMNTIGLIKKSLNPDLDIEGVLMTMYDYRTNLSNEVYSEVKNFFKEKVYKSTITRNIRLAEAPSFGLPIMLYDEKCKGADAYKALTKEFLDRQ